MKINRIALCFLGLAIIAAAGACTVQKVPPGSDLKSLALQANNAVNDLKTASARGDTISAKLAVSELAKIESRGLTGNNMPLSREEINRYVERAFETVARAQFDTVRKNPAKLGENEYVAVANRMRNNLVRGGRSADAFGTIDALHHRMGIVQFAQARSLNRNLRLERHTPVQIRAMRPPARLMKSARVALNARKYAHRRPR